MSAYLSGYAATAGQISEIARQISASAGPELLARLDEANAEAQEHLGRLGAFDRVVSTQRGPMLLSDFLDTRLIELVVHAGDLAASLPAHHPPTVLPTASRRVALVMRELLTEKAAQPVEALAAASTMAVARFIALAAGRDLPAGDLPPADLPAALTSALPLF
nr:maleylpyruvate isomerase N-terminal domain-containing protein [Nakamurella sp. PAMC28650]